MNEFAFHFFLQESALFDQEVSTKEHLKLRRAFSEEKAELKKIKAGVSSSFQQIEKIIKNMEHAFVDNFTTLVNGITEQTNQLFQTFNDTCNKRYLVISHL